MKENLGSHSKLKPHLVVPQNESRLSVGIIYHEKIEKTLMTQSTSFGLQLNSIGKLGSNEFSIMT